MKKRSNKAPKEEKRHESTKQAVEKFVEDNKEVMQALEAMKRAQVLRSQTFLRSKFAIHSL